MKRKIIAILMFAILTATTQSGIAFITNLDEDYTPWIPCRPQGSDYGYCNESYEFETSSIDPSPDKELWYQWDWGDGTIDDWTDKYVSGHLCKQNHSWEEPGDYEIRVRCKNNYNTSDWSESFLINITIYNFAPLRPIINGPVEGRAFKLYTYTFITLDFEEENVSYFIDWGDGKNSGWIGPVEQGTHIEQSHRWLRRGIYSIRAKAKDVNGKESLWTNEGFYGYDFNVSIQRYRIIDLIRDILDFLNQEN